MRVLVISPLFVPLADSEAFCGGKVVIGLAKRGVESAVLAFQLLDAIPEERLDNSAIWKPLVGATVRIPSNQPRQLIRSSIFGLRYRTLAYARSVRDAVDKAKSMHAERPFDLVYSRSLPMIAHVIGYWSSRSLRLPWMANINDPWDVHLAPDAPTANMSLLEKYTSNYWLRKTIRSADLITYPSDRLWKYHEQCSGIEHHAEVIPHIGLSRDSHRDRNAITIVHAGKIGKNENPVRSPAGFFRAMGKVLASLPAIRDRVRIVFVGPEDEYTSRLALDCGLKVNLQFTGRVDYEESLRRIGSADLCLLVEAKYRIGIYLPSKLADYLVGRKPVVALSPKEGTVADLAAFNGVFRADPDDVDAIEEVLTRLISSIVAGESRNIAPAEELVATFEGVPIFEKLIRCMGAIVRR